MALVLEHHVHRAIARAWWHETNGPIAFTRFTELGLLRLLTTSAAMDAKPLSMDEAWRVYDGLFADERVALYPEPGDAEARFRDFAKGGAASPKRWCDAWLLAVARAAEGALITFDRALGTRGAHCLLQDFGARS